MTARPELDQWIADTEWVTWEPGEHQAPDVMVVRYADDESVGGLHPGYARPLSTGEVVELANEPESEDCPLSVGWYQSSPLQWLDPQWVSSDDLDADLDDAELAEVLNSLFASLGTDLTDALRERFIPAWIAAASGITPAYEVEIVFDEAVPLAPPRPARRKPKRICPQHGQPVGACRLCWRGR